MSSDVPNPLPPSDSFDEAAPRLSDADARVLDRLVEVGFDRARIAAARDLSPSDLDRADRMLALFATIDAYPASEHDDDDADLLVSATLARIDRADDERAERLRFGAGDEESQARRPRFGVRRSNLIAAACIAILATSVIVPIVHFSSEFAVQSGCSNNLRLVASGLEQYAHDFDGMPMRASFLPDLTNWANYKHSDNLRVLESSHYCPPGCMCCAGDKAVGATYASQAPAATRKPLWNTGPRIAIVSDRNPLVELRREGVPVGAVAVNSSSHGGHGQNILFTDGTIQFLTQPYVGPYVDDPTQRSDNIWLPFGDRADSLLRPTNTEVDTFMLQ